MISMFFRRNIWIGICFDDNRKKVRMAMIVMLALRWLFPLISPIELAAFSTLALVLSTALGFCVGLLVHWVLSVRFVFRAVKDEESVRSRRSFALFALIGMIGLALTEVGVVTLVAVLPELTIFGTTALLGTAWKKWLAKAVMTCLVLVFNYLGRKFFIFKS